MSNDSTITGLPSATALAGGEVFPADQGGVTSKVTGNQIKTLVTSGLSTGQVLFGAAGSTIGQDTKLFWDNSNKRLGVGNAVPAQALDVTGTGNFSTSVIAPQATTPIVDSGIAGTLALKTNNGTTGLQILDVSSGNRNLTISSSNGGNPTIAATAGSPAITYAAAGGSGTPTGHTFTMYEEGTWIPSVGGNATYTLQTGVYIKIGKMVFVDAIIIINVLGTGSNNTVSGLPFTAASGVNAFLATGLCQSLASSVVFLVGAVTANGTSVQMQSRTAAATQDTSANAIFGNSAQVQFSGCYMASA